MRFVAILLGLFLVLSFCLITTPAAAGVAGEKNIEARKEICQEKPYGNVKERTWISKDPYVYPPTGEKWDRGEVCQWTLKDGRILFEDGCSGQAPGKAPQLEGDSKRLKWGVLFHDACVQHDFCYHSNPITYGQSQDDCDREMQENMHNICDDYFGDDQINWNLCSAAADTMYAALRTLGKKHYNAFNMKVEYRDIVNGSYMSPTSGKCPPFFYRKDTYQGKPVCESNAWKPVEISEDNCTKKDGIVTSGDCYIPRKRGWYNLRPLKDECPATFVSEGSFNGKPACRSKVALRITEENCKKDNGTIHGPDCYFLEKKGWYKIRPLASEKCPLTNPHQLGEYKGKAVCKAVLKINEKNCKKDGGVIVGDYCYLLEKKGWYKARPLR